MPEIDADPRDLETVRVILRRYLPDREVWAFGSRVGRTPKRFSDLDLVILGAGSVSATTLADLREAFDESDLPFKVDLVDWATSSDAFRRIIESRHVSIHEARPDTGRAR